MATPRIEKIVKKKIASPMIPPRLCTDSINVPSKIFSEGIDVNSLSGLKSLKALKAARAFPPLNFYAASFMIKSARDEETTTKSIQFHPSPK